MDQKRLDLHDKFVELLGSENVYFQPPEASKMEYPCIVYKRSRIRTKFADNSSYRLHRVFMVTAIYTDPDSDLPMKLAELPMCLHDRQFTTDNLYHDVFNIAIL